MSEKQLVDTLYELTLGTDGFFLKLRMNHQFCDHLYQDITQVIKELIMLWQEQDKISKKGFLCILNLIEVLSGQDSYLSEQDNEKMQSAFMEVTELLYELEC